jgi:hypothetical protein
MRGERATDLAEENGRLRIQLAAAILAEDQVKIDILRAAIENNESDSTKYG